MCQGCCRDYIGAGEDFEIDSDLKEVTKRQAGYNWDCRRVVMSTFGCIAGVVAILLVHYVDWASCLGQIVGQSSLQGAQLV